jgi:hypothetical protein
MSFTFITQVKSFLLPGDGDEAQAEFLTALRSPFPTYLVAYGFTLDAMISELLAAHAAGIPVHIYLDHTQAGGTKEKPEVQRLVDAGMDVTIGTSPTGSGFICHTKGMVVLDQPGSPYCWEGSCNFSASGWKQVNSVNTFRSPEWANHFMQQFSLLKSFAWTHERKFQLLAEPLS